MAVTPMTYHGDVTFTVENGHKYVATVNAKGAHTFIKGRKYMANGDPGYPDEDESEIDDIDVIEVKDWDTEEPVDYNEETMYDPIYDALEDEEWESEEQDPEPDDYWEERAMAQWERELDACGL